MKDTPALLEQNLRHLEKFQPKLAARLREELDSIDELPPVEIQETAAGRWVKVGEGEPFFDREPVLPNRHKSKDVYCFIIQGVGYPPFLFHILRSISKDTLSVVVLEPDVRLLLLTLSMTSVYHAVPKGARISFISYDERALLDEAMWYNVTPIGIFPLLQAEIISHDGLLERNLDESQRAQLQKSFWETIRYLTEQLGNSPEDTLLGVRHGALNTPWILKGPTLSELKIAFGKRPAVCVASGPSLKKNVDLLRGREDDTLIIACDSSLISLLRRGIRPHVVVTIERNLMYEVWVPKVLEEYYEECSRILLVSQSVSEPLTAGRWPGPVFVVGKMDSPADRWLVHEVLGMNLLMSGMSVAHMAMTFALSMDAPAIALIGQDLAFADDGETTHVEDAASATPDGIARERAYAKREVPGVNGGSVKTHQMWLYFLQIFERFLDDVDEGRVFQCSEAGAAIDGATAIPLARFLEEYSGDAGSAPLSESFRELCIEKKRFCEYAGEIARNLKSAEEGLAYCEELLDNMEKEVELALAPAISPERRRRHAVKAADTLDEIHASHRALAFIGQSYTHIAGASLAKNRFMDTVERVNDWGDVHRGIISSHRVNVRFIKQWLGYMEALSDPETWVLLDERSSWNDKELVNEAQEVLAAFFDDVEKTGLLSKSALLLSYLLCRVDMLRYEDISPQLLWNFARFLSLQGRAFEACSLMQRAYSMLEGSEASAETVALFLLDWARMESAHDLIRVPRFDLALALYQNIPERCPEMTELVEQEKAALLKSQKEFMDGVLRFMSSSEEMKALACRNSAQEALASKDLPEAFKWVMKMGEFLEASPSLVLPHMQWLAKTSLECRGAMDPKIDNACREALSYLYDMQEKLSYFGFPWPSEWLSYLKERGVDLELVAGQSTSDS